MGDFLWKSLISEFIGTFTLVFIGASAVALTLAQGGSLLGSAFAFGLVLMTLIYVWGPYSGAHLNPAVSFGFAVAGQMNWALMLGYWVAQLVGGIAAAALVMYFFGTANGAGASIGSLTNTDAWKAILLEAFLTFFLVLAYLFIYRNPMLAIVAGIAIGLVLTFAMLAAGPLTGASMNPARSLGPAIFSNNMGTYWIYIVGPLLGALVAALIYKLFVRDWSCCDKLDDCGKPILDACGNKLKVCKRPVVDSCGRAISDCNGAKFEQYLKVDRKYGHMQETPLHYMGQLMNQPAMAASCPLDRASPLRASPIRNGRAPTVVTTTTNAPLTTTTVSQPQGFFSSPHRSNNSGKQNFVSFGRQNQRSLKCWIVSERIFGFRN
jgi:MIP family channel proteins